MSGMLKDGTTDYALQESRGRELQLILLSSLRFTVVDSIFSPTTKPQAGVVKAMNYSFYGRLSLILLRIPSYPC